MLSQLALLLGYLVLPAFLVLGVRFGLLPCISRLRKSWSQSSPDAQGQSAESLFLSKTQESESQVQTSPRIHLYLKVLPFLFLFGAMGYGQEVQPSNQKHVTPPPIHSAKGVIASAWDKDHIKHARGLTKTPRHRLISAPRFAAGATAPAQVLMLPKQLSMWGNSQYGDCVSASEAACKAAYSVYCGLPETFIPEATVIAWARKYGYLNGANLEDVMTTMQTKGMTASDGKVYTDGPYLSVDFTNEALLQAAIAVGPVNIGLDADALPSGAGNKSAWFAFGGSPGQFSNEDHCVAFFGYGPTATLFKSLSDTYGVNVAPPAGAPANGYLLFTWSTVGVVDHAWIMSTVGETWVRNPTTPGQSPQPQPVPPTPPTPPVPPGPTPSGATITLSQSLPAGTLKVVAANAAVLDDTDVAALQAILSKINSRATPAQTKEPLPALSNDGAMKLVDAIIILQKTVAEQMKRIAELEKQLTDPKKMSQLDSPVTKEFAYVEVYPDVRRADADRLAGHLARFVRGPARSSRVEQQRLALDYNGA